VPLLHHIPPKQQQQQQQQQQQRSNRHSLLMNFYNALNYIFSMAIQPTSMEFSGKE
jgi:threonine/homoserine/homoserine lactone efflux protein